MHLIDFFFEYQTEIAILYFIKNKTDVIVLEVGMGSRLDATNALEKNNLFDLYNNFIGS